MVFKKEDKSMKIITTGDKGFGSEFKAILNRAKLDIDSVEGVVKDILNDIKNRGDKALLEHISKFDRWEPKSAEELIIPKKELKKAYDGLDSELKEALHIAYDRIKAYHEKQVQKSWIDFESNGTILGQKVTPIEKAGLYIPGGKAVYPSSLLMNAIPALVAGVEEIIVTTPTPQNYQNPLLLASCYLCNVTKVFKVGGASAIGALAYSTETIPKVDVITGPGNIFVATAKELVFGDVNIDMVAGPSEIGVIADKSAKPKHIAIDMLSQAEHDEMASSILITDSLKIAKKTEKAIYKYLKTLQRREIASKSIEDRASIIVTKDIDEAIKLMNEIAPEHLEVITANPFELLPKIKNAGAIFLGDNTPEAVGDYIAGPNHTLPTGSTAKFFSPLSVDNFIKKSSIISFSKKALNEVGKYGSKIADVEGLEAHKLSIDKRRK
jgi:histidinol dehydrogenase